MLKSIVILASVLAGFQALAVDADFSGSYRFRLTSDVLDSSAVNFDAVKNMGFENRTQVSGSFRPSESFEGNAALHLNYASPADVNQAYEVYGDWMLSDEFMLRVGQSSYKIADGSVIGLNDYQAFPTLLRGAFLTHSSENLGLDVALVQKSRTLSLIEGTNNPFLIVSVDVKSLPDAVKDINLHAIVNNVMEGNVVGDSRVGLTLGGDLPMNLGYRATVASSSLDMDSVQDNLMVDGKIKYKHEMDNSKVKVYVGGHLDGANYDPFLYEIHKNAGSLDSLVQWGGGLVYAKLGLSYWMNSGWGLGAVGHYFLESGANNSIEDRSMEVDLYVKKDFGSSIVGKVWAGVLRSGSATNLQTQAALQMRF